MITTRFSFSAIKGKKEEKKIKTLNFHNGRINHNTYWRRWSILDQLNLL